MDATTGFKYHNVYHVSIIYWVRREVKGDFEKVGVLLQCFGEQV
jgi:hypothetical protein